MNTLKQEIKEMDKNQLREKLSEFQKEYCALRLNAATAHIKDYSKFKKLRRDVARLKTALNEKLD
jgi:large subunit ribosomal protein L29